MAQNFPFAEDNEWQAAARFTAGAETPLLLGNPDFEDRGTVRFTITQDDTIPTLSVTDAQGVRPGSPQPFTLQSGDRLWMAGPVGKSATIEF